VKLAVDVAGMMGGEVGVLVCKDITDCVMDVF